MQDISEKLKAKSEQFSNCFQHKNRSIIFNDGSMDHLDQKILFKAFADIKQRHEQLEKLEKEKFQRRINKRLEEAQELKDMNVEERREAMKDLDARSGIFQNTQRRS